MAPLKRRVGFSDEQPHGSSAATTVAPKYAKNTASDLPRILVRAPTIDSAKGLVILYPTEAGDDADGDGTKAGFSHAVVKEIASDDEASHHSFNSSDEGSSTAKGTEAAFTQVAARGEIASDDESSEQSSPSRRARSRTNSQNEGSSTPISSEHESRPHSLDRRWRNSLDTTEFAISHQGGIFVTAVESGEEDSEAEDRDILKDVDTENDRRAPEAANASVLSLREPGVQEQDIQDSKGKNAPPPSEEDITDRGERAYNDLKSQGLTGASPIDDEADDLEECFSDRLFDAMEPKFNNIRKFMPRGKLDTLVNVAAVERELSELRRTPEDRSIRSYAEEICGEPFSPRPNNLDIPSNCPKTYRKIFALLVFVRKLESIFKFLDEGVSDLDLPLTEYIHPDPTRSPRGLKLRRKNDATRPLQCFQGWPKMVVKDFCDHQWIMLAPVFVRSEHKNVRHYQLTSDDILPYTFDSRWGTDATAQNVLERGGFGEVFKVCIHRNHHNFLADPKSPTDRFFAVKRLYSKNEDDWKREIEILKRFSSNTHPHLISLLATYEHSGSAHLIFHWADADMLRYWKDENPMPTMDAVTVRWFARQCRGIANGIAAIHQHVSNPLATQGREKGGAEQPGDPGDRKNDGLYGRHGDIKPRNILWFKDPADPKSRGTFVITDFGIAEMSSRGTRSGKPNRNLQFTLTYCAPESHIPGGEISRSYDIWTLGCLYLEFLTWLLGGWKLVQQFANGRQKPERFISSDDVCLDVFFELETSGEAITGAKVKQEVTDFIANLHLHPACTDYIHDFLNLIQEEMLIVETREPKRYRFTSQQVCARLTRLEQKCNDNKSYGLPKLQDNPEPEFEGEAAHSQPEPITSGTTSTLCESIMAKRATY
ncbi:hypothetical protein B0H63DRAFT_74217 [Podospora didyma]|uniref:Protein kinase domain-containing protein n=1 Tax=Podospora didyma TaxID=330526 RepID=A0AAE0K1D9_9PEZI|nr:hypothetical protein B0H63DRAFT_74217 [Podospora didyma]